MIIGMSPGQGIRTCGWVRTTRASWPPALRVGLSAMFLMTGSADTLAGSAANGRPVFTNANVPVFWGELQGASHFVPAFNGGGYRGPSTAWYRFHLMGDKNAESVFYGADCTLCTSSDWKVQKKGIQ